MEIKFVKNIKRSGYTGDRISSKLSHTLCQPVNKVITIEFRVFHSIFLVGGLAFGDRVRWAQQMGEELALGTELDEGGLEKIVCTGAKNAPLQQN